MLPSSQSESSGLAGRKRKAAEDVEHILSKIFTRMRQEVLLSGFEEDEWEKMVARVLDDPELRQVISARNLGPVSNCHIDRTR
jgi:hypothetical protein